MYFKLKDKGLRMKHVLVEMTEQEAHDKVNEWMDFEKEALTLTEMDTHHFGKVELHKVICEIYGIGDDERLAVQLIKNHKEVNRMKERFKDPEFAEQVGTYCLSRIHRLEESNKKIEKAILFSE